LCLALAGCGRAAPTAEVSGSPALPCPVNGPAIDLGAAYPDQPPTTFRFTGRRAVFTATGFLHDAPLDPDVGMTMVHLGPAEKLPEYDPARNKLSNVTVSFTVVEGKPTLHDLPSGRYWIVTGGLRVAIQPCDDGEVSDVELAGA
jgi:hypothetical protein